MEVSDEEAAILRGLRKKVDAQTTTEVAQVTRLLLAMAASDDGDWFHRIDLDRVDDADLLQALDAAIEVSACRHAALQAFAEDNRDAIADRRSRTNGEGRPND
jgi:hypothetical protein